MDVYQEEHALQVALASGELVEAALTQELAVGVGQVVEADGVPLQLTQGHKVFLNNKHSHNPQTSRLPGKTYMLCLFHKNIFANVYFKVVSQTKSL